MRYLRGAPFDIGGGGMEVFWRKKLHPLLRNKNKKQKKNFTNLMRKKNFASQICITQIT